MKVLLTDGNYKHTLAAVRALGAKNIEVSVLSYLPFSISFYSKYCKKHYVIPKIDNTNKFIESVFEIVKKGDYDVILPIGLSSVLQFSKNKARLEEYVHVPIADEQSIEIASNKDQTVKFAESYNVPIPKTFYPRNMDDVHDISVDVEYPMVIKGIKGQGNVEYANSANELMQKCNKICAHPLIIQEYIQGDGYGFFALYNHGVPKAMFMHKRLREYPKTGGPSTFAESVYDSRLRELGLRILDNLNWHGVAMVEFKNDVKNGDFILMEINPKFWGSLDLAIASDVNFPYLICEMAMHKNMPQDFEYETGVRFRWLMPGDIFHLIKSPMMLPQFCHELCDPTINYDIKRNDIKPNIAQFGMMCAEFILRLKERRL